jgi:hypothetical protein
LAGHIFVGNGMKGHVEPEGFDGLDAHGLTIPQIAHSMNRNSIFPRSLSLSFSFGPARL